MAMTRFLNWLRNIFRKAKGLPPLPKPEPPKPEPQDDPPPVRIFSNPVFDDTDAERCRCMYQAQSAKGERLKIHFPSGMVRVYGVRVGDQARVTWDGGEQYTERLIDCYQIDDNEGTAGYSRPKFELRAPWPVGSFTVELLDRVTGETLAAFRWRDYRQSGSFRLPLELAL